MILTVDSIIPLLFFSSKLGSLIVIYISIYRALPASSIDVANASGLPSGIKSCKKMFSVSESSRKRRFAMPTWLLKKYNPDINLAELRIGQEIVVPVVEARFPQETLTN